MTAPAYKLSGGGNDFIALAEPADLPSAETIRAWCRRGLSIGADGVFVLDRRPDGGVRMQHFNADGGAAELCVNGTRCAARLAFHLGWAAGEVTVETASGPIVARPAGEDRIALSLSPPDRAPGAVRLTVGGETWDGHYLVVGVPHLVLAWDSSLDDAPVERLGPLLRRHPDLGDAGANVDFVDYRGADAFDIRTFERGVEAETLACGSGVLAATAVGIATGRCALPVTVRTRGGAILTVDGRADRGRPHDWTLSGDARLVAELTLRPAATAQP